MSTWKEKDECFPVKNEYGEGRQEFYSETFLSSVSGGSRMVDGLRANSTLVLLWNSM